MIGKRVGNDVYVHASAIDTIPHADIRGLALQLAASINPDVFVYRKSRKDTGIVSLGVRFVDDFDGVDEPHIVRSELWVLKDGGPHMVKTRTYGANKPVYHAKHFMVAPTYAGFDVEAYMARYEAYIRKHGGTPWDKGYSNQWDAWRIPNVF